jgi:hypothetical protein
MASGDPSLWVIYYGNQRLTGELVVLSNPHF